jgi:hypothetical protein
MSSKFFINFIVDYFQLQSDIIQEKGVYETIHTLKVIFSNKYKILNEGNPDVLGNKLISDIEITGLKEIGFFNVLGDFFPNLNPHNIQFQGIHHDEHMRRRPMEDSSRGAGGRSGVTHMEDEMCPKKPPISFLSGITNPQKLLRKRVESQEEIKTDTEHKPSKGLHLDALIAKQKTITNKGFNEEARRKEQIRGEVRKQLDDYRKIRNKIQSRARKQHLIDTYNEGRASEQNEDIINIYSEAIEELESISNEDTKIKYLKYKNKYLKLFNKQYF